MDECLGGSVQTWLTQHEVVFIFLRVKIFGQNFRTQCAETFSIEDPVSDQRTAEKDGDSV